MPYIFQEDRKRIDEIVRLVPLCMEDGELNYLITTLLLRQMDRLSYKNCQRMVGLLECIKLEFYRKEVAPYEDEKAESNGEVF